MTSFNPRQQASAPASWLRRYASQLRVFEAIFWSEIRALHGPTGFGFLLVLLEPVFHVGLICFWHWVIRIKPVYGTSKVLFLASGLYPVFIFIHVASHARRSGKNAKRRLPPETTLDIIAAGALVNFIVYLYVGVIFFFTMSIVITPQAIPFDYQAVLTSSLALGLLGTGTGLINAGIEPVFPAWHAIFGPFVRMMALFSGVLFVADNTLPVNVRYWLSFNPVMHALERFRMGFYPEYPKLIYSWTYLWGWVVCTLIVGLVLERATRNYKD